MRGVLCALSGFCMHSEKPNELFSHTRCIPDCWRLWSQWAFRICWLVNLALTPPIRSIVRLISKSKARRIFLLNSAVSGWRTSLLSDNLSTMVQANETNWSFSRDFRWMKKLCSEQWAKYLDGFSLCTRVRVYVMCVCVCVLWQQKDSAAVDTLTNESTANNNRQTQKVVDIFTSHSLNGTLQMIYKWAIQK